MICQNRVIAVDKYPNLYYANKDILIYKEDILKITAIPKNSIDLIVTSPPYNVDIHYNFHIDNLSYEDYLEFTQKWLKNVLI